MRILPSTFTNNTASIILSPSSSSSSSSFVCEPTLTHFSFEIGLSREAPPERDRLWPFDWGSGRTTRSGIRHRGLRLEEEPSLPPCVLSLPIVSLAIAPPSFENRERERWIGPFLKSGGFKLNYHDEIFTFEVGNTIEIFHFDDFSEPEKKGLHQLKNDKKKKKRKRMVKKRRKREEEEADKKN
ncbi:hypothetical protein PIB30_059517 [Stylosanthes scabra]|uniref:Uncharacterized protein n=1 Tax=Stylosanthes scabra TaxID=79078 RepID=A0ABU6ZJ22_9FABA|nr:hypothetical protein [Stylosanthes scabra]